MLGVLSKIKQKCEFFTNLATAQLNQVFFCIQFVFKTVVLIIQNWNFDKKTTIFSYSTDHKFSYAILNIFRLMDFWEIFANLYFVKWSSTKERNKKKSFNIYLQKNKQFNKTSDTFYLYLNIPKQDCPPWATCCYLGTL